jgi:hypothetical protein
MRTLGSFNHPGLDEEPTAISLRSSPKGSGADDPTVGSPTRVAARVGLFPWNTRTLVIRINTRCAAKPRLEGWQHARIFPSFEGRFAATSG